MVGNARRPIAPIANFRSLTEQCCSFEHDCRVTAPGTEARRTKRLGAAVYNCSLLSACDAVGSPYMA